MSRHDAPSADSTPRRPPTKAEMAGIDQAMRAGNMAQATQLAGRAAAQGAEQFALLTLAAHDSLNRGAADEALAYALRARALAPRDPAVLNVYGLALLKSGRAQEAIAAFDAALRQSPGQAELHYNKGSAYEDLNDDGRARLCFERAAAIEPRHVNALSRLAFMAALAGDRAKARELADHALRLAPNEPTATLALAQADVGDKQFEAALARLVPLRSGPSRLNKTIAEGLAADALDGLGRRDEAFRAYSAANATRRALVKPHYEAEGVESARAQVERLTAYFRDAALWPRAEAETPDRTHVFLVGFPRSGTTLLEQVLAMHPDVESMEERLCLDDANAEFFDNAEGLDRLAALPQEDLEPWREAYWRRAAEWGVAPSCPVFIDKLPLNVVSLCLIARLFPHAKILFALRDPMDVVWSCFRRRFGMSLQMYEFLTLNGAARYYDAVMGLAMLYREKLALDLHELRYENLVGDFDGETQRLCAFLGLEWRAELAGFAAKARTVNTPSAAQLGRGLYDTAVGQWTAYREHLAPVLPVLAPWRARFGYV